MKRLPIALLVSLVTALGSIDVRADAVGYSSLPDAISFKHFGVEDGLPENQTFDILQDRQGFIWIATRGGVSRFDGGDFVTYKHRDGDESSLSSNYVWGLMEDREGFIWVGTAIGGLSRFNPRSGTFTSFTNPDIPIGGDSAVSNSVWGMVEDPGGGVWVGIIGKGLEFRNPDTGEFKVFRLDSADTDAIGGNSPTTLMFDKSRRFWVGTYGAGLLLLDPETGDTTSFRNDPDDPNSLVNDFVWVIEEDSRGFLWIGTDNGLSRFEPKTVTFRNYQRNGPEGFSATQVTSVHEDENGYIWFGTRSSGIDIYNPETERFQSITSKSGASGGLSSNSVFKIIQDDQNGYWIATENGVDYYSPKQEQFGHAYGAAGSDQDRGLTESHVLAFHEGPSGKIWIGTAGGGLNLYNPNNDNFESFRHDPNDPTTLSTDMIIDIAGDSKGILWVATSEGLNAFTPSDGTAIRYADDPRSGNSLDIKNIYSVAVDKRDRVWVATYGEGVNRLDTESGEVRKFRNDPRDVNSLSVDLAGDVMVDRLGRAWVATEFGLNRIDPETDAVTRFFHDDSDPKSLSSSLVNAAYEDSKGRIWVATDNGVNLFEEETETFRRFPFGGELPSNLIYDVVEDDLDYIWLSTGNGLVRFDPVSNEVPRVFDYRDGLQNSRFGRNSAMKARDGSLYFGGKRGFNRILPDRIVSSTFSPPVVITDIRVFNESVPIGKGSGLDVSARYATKVTFTPDQLVFSFSFSALDFNAPSRILYKYKLEGFDSDWRQTSSRNRWATYTNIDPGEYTFRVRAANADGIWSDKEATLSISVLPPWWATVKFQIAIWLSVLLILVGGYRWRIHSVERRNVELKKLVDEQNTDLKIRNEQYFSLFDHIPNGVILYQWDEANDTFLVVDLNQAAEKILDVPRSNIINRPVEETPPLKGDGADLRITLRQVYSTGVPIHSTPIQVKRGDRHYWWEHIVYRLDSGQIVEVISDITDHIVAREILREAKNRAEDASDAKSAFLANISHEIRTPLTSLLGTSRLLEKTPLNEQQMHLLQALDGSGKVLLHLLNDIIDVSRIESGHLKLERLPFDPAMLVEQTVDAMRGNAQQKGLKLSLETTELPAAVYGDPMRFQQVLTNLLGNAVKFTAKGQVSMAVNAESVNDKTVSIHFAISDTGEGIAEEAIGRLFTPFAQEDDSTIRKYGGSGLGLSICKRLVEAMGGEIGVESTKGEGSTFWFVVDLEKCGEAPDAPVDKRTQRSPALSILLVDDIDISRQVVAMMLEDEGHRVEQASSGSGALEAVLENSFDLILMDVRMPDMDGAATTRAIRRLPKSEGGETPVFAFTADALPESENAHIAAGMSETITKPLRMDVFNQVLIKHFGDAGSARAGDVPAQPGSAASLLDWGNINQYRQVLGEAGLRNMLDRFRTDGSKLLNDILSDTKNSDMKSVAWNAHKLKGAAGSIGFATLSDQAGDIQGIAETGNKDALGDAVKRLIELERKSILALDAFIGDPHRK